LKTFRTSIEGYVQGSLTEEEGSVQLTSSHSLVKKYFFYFYVTSYIKEEVNCTEPSPSVSIPWLVY